MAEQHSAVAPQRENVCANVCMSEYDLAHTVKGCGRAWDQGVGSRKLGPCCARPGIRLGCVRLRERSAGMILLLPWQPGCSFPGLMFPGTAVLPCAPPTQPGPLPFLVAGRGQAWAGTSSACSRAPLQSPALPRGTGSPGNRLRQAGSRRRAHINDDKTHQNRDVLGGDSGRGCLGTVIRGYPGPRDRSGPGDGAVPAVPALLARAELDERPERPGLRRRHLAPVLPAQPVRHPLGQHELGPRHQHGPRALGGAAARDPADIRRTGRRSRTSSRARWWSTDQQLGLRHSRGPAHGRDLHERLHRRHPTLAGGRRSRSPTASTTARPGRSTRATRARPRLDRTSATRRSSGTRTPRRASRTGSWWPSRRCSTRSCSTGATTSRRGRTSATSARPTRPAASGSAPTCSRSRSTATRRTPSGCSSSTSTPDRGGRLRRPVLRRRLRRHDLHVREHRGGGALPAGDVFAGFDGGR